MRIIEIKEKPVTIYQPKNQGMKITVRLHTDNLSIEQSEKIKKFFETL